MRKLSSLAVLFVVAAVLCAGTAAFAFDKNHLMKFKAMNVCPKCDLSGADLSGADLSEADLSEANLRGANLKGANLQEAYLSNADFTGATIEGANMKGAHFCKSKMPWGLEKKDC